MSRPPDRAEPSSVLSLLGRSLAGSWRLSGGAVGLIRYEWAPGGFFLMQHVDIVAFGRPVTGLEVIGHLHRVGENATAEIWSRFYSFGDGLTLDYVYEIEGLAFTIWFGARGADNRFKGLLSEDRRTYAGAWAWPGGGYEVAATRVA